MDTYLNDIKIWSAIKKNVKKKKWTCLHSGCENLSINSHFLQRNGVLSLLTVKNHIYELRENDIFNINEKGKFYFAKLGINRAFSLPLFCQEHDNNLFEPVENGKEYSFDDYKVQLLFSLRSCCNEIRRKEILIEEYRRLLQSRVFQNKKVKEIAKNHMEGNILGVKDLNFYRTCFESNLQDTNSVSFSFRVYKFPLLKICASGVFSPMDYSKTENIGKYAKQEAPLDTVFVNIVPTETDIFLIFGFHKEHGNQWIYDYIESWNNISLKTFTLILTDLLAARMSTWSISPELLDKIPDEKQLLFIKYWNQNFLDLSIQQNVGFDLFAKNYGS